MVIRSSALNAGKIYKRIFSDNSVIIWPFITIGLGRYLSKDSNTEFEAQSFEALAGFDR
jgi:hypothetical protein